MRARCVGWLLCMHLNILFHVIVFIDVIIETTISELRICVCYFYVRIICEKLINIVRENVCNKAKNVKSHGFWILKKCKSNDIKVLQTTQSVIVL